ncbi:hypothetical protein GOP47_0000225 [Adiantum capillus-veneris]|uniref:Fungal lipase-type domain-containing protein n=1 Tax=Adiantum capillus-veneris TaxID=13818 RepID=A0A9D4ZS67_ADICA|nr:hypothetical protein GOP47_0000225 [Adiantum capillus-veneris]
MDSLLSKIGPLKALVPVKKGLTDVSQMQPRSVHVCVCRPPSADSKPSAIASKALPMQEASTDSALSPLPLPSSHATVPPPLKFLWFKRKSSGASVEERQTDRDIDNECCNMASIQKTHLDAIGESNVALTETTKSWISRITDIKALWPNRKAPNASVDIPKSHPSSAKEELAPPTVSDCDGSCDSCVAGDCDGCSLEVPYTKVLHSKDTFFQFLHDASLFDMKVLAQMSFLCDMAYMIPDIQPGQLLKYHHLKFVTSSLEKKAEAETLVKEADRQKRTVRSDKLASSGGDKIISKGKTADSDDATHIPEAESISPCTTDGSQANTDNEAELKVGMSNPQGNVEPSDDESFMAVAPATAIVLAEEETKLAVAKDLQTSSTCPCEWFVCDDESSCTRLFVIQGSESVASWQANLFFEPTKFEGLDVLVHRGIYEAANALYEQILPEVLAHFSAHDGLTQVRLTGHSLGGSLATLLALMFQIRGVLPRKCILPVVTFGSPCIMCGGDSLLHKMDLPTSHIQSIIMHRDVVPRAFSCDYPDQAAQILKRLNGKFRDHPCLNNQKLLYAPMGQLLILQPDETTAPSHPLLPCGYGLYLLRHPTNEGGVERATELRGAQRAFLNMPHPLEILSDPGAYGLNGAISRDHNPRSYSKAIHVVLRHEVKRLRRVQREQRRQLWWPLVISETSWFAQRGRNLSSIVDHDNTDGALMPAVCKSSLFSGHTIFQGKFSAFHGVGFTLISSSSLWESQKAAVSRYARLIASKHVQLGMLFIVSLRVVIVECLQTIYVWI